MGIRRWGSEIDPRLQIIRPLAPKASQVCARGFATLVNGHYSLSVNGHY